MGPESPFPGKEGSGSKNPIPHRPHTTWKREFSVKKSPFFYKGTQGKWGFFDRTLLFPGRGKWGDGDSGPCLGSEEFFQHLTKAWLGRPRPWAKDHPWILICVTTLGSECWNGGCLGSGKSKWGLSNGGLRQISAICAQSSTIGPVLRDTARLSQRYPPIARYGVFGVSTWPIRCDTPFPLF